MDALERVIRAAGLPVRYTEGFNPHIRLSMGPALSVGHEGLAEIFDVDCTAPLNQQHITKLNSLLPEGVRISDAQALMPGAPSLGKMIDTVRYRLPSLSEDHSWPESADGLETDLRGAVRRWQLHEDGGLSVELNARQQAGPTPSVKKLLLELGFDDIEAARLRVTREGFVLRRKNSGPVATVDAKEAAQP